MNTAPLAETSDPIDAATEAVVAPVSFAARLRELATSGWSPRAATVPACEPHQVWLDRIKKPREEQPPPGT